MFTNYPKKAIEVMAPEKLFEAGYETHSELFEKKAALNDAENDILNDNSLDTEDIKSLLGSIKIYSVQVDQAKTQYQNIRDEIQYRGLWQEWNQYRLNKTKQAK